MESWIPAGWYRSWALAGKTNSGQTTDDGFGLGRMFAPRPVTRVVASRRQIDGAGVEIWHPFHSDHHIQEQHMTKIGIILGSTRPFRST
jgi:hypothetical protein